MSARRLPARIFVLVPLLAHLLGQLIVLSRLGAVGLRCLPMLLCLAAVHLDVAQTDVCQVVVQQCGRVVHVGAGPAGRRRKLGRPLRSQPGLLGELTCVVGLAARRPLRRVISSYERTLIVAKVRQAVPRFLSPLPRLVGAFAGLGRPAVAPLPVSLLARLTHDRSMPRQPKEWPAP